MRIYVGTFLIALATLSLEIAMTRILSVTTWYHLAFFAISTAMLGMTAGAVVVYLRPAWFAPEYLERSLSRACWCFALATPVSLIVLCLLPLSLFKSVMSLIALMVATCACSLPFYFSGIAITAVLTRSRYPIGRLYAFDLIGASLGCLFVLGALEILDAPSLVLACAVAGLLAALCFGWTTCTGRQRGGMVLLLLIFTAVVPLNAASSAGIRPMVVKGRVLSAAELMIEKWNSFSRVVVFNETQRRPQLWGPSPRADRSTTLPQHYMNIDGEAGTTIRRFASPADLDHLRYDVTNAAYYLRGHGGACIVGVGAGRDVLSAKTFGHERILGLDVNPIFIGLLQNEFREFSGIDKVANLELVADEARSFLSRSNETFEVVQMSLIDTWAATGAGAFSLSENGLYTVEAWRVFLERLSPTGIFTVSRWYNPTDLGETARVVSLAVATLLEMGIPDPSQHIAMLTAANVSTVMVSRSPFAPADVTTLATLAQDLEYGLAILPGTPPTHAMLRDIVSADSPSALATAVEHDTLNCTAPTDENPYFFNMAKLSALGQVHSLGDGVVRGNLVATLTLVALIVCLACLALLTIVLPVLLRGRRELASRVERGRILPGAVYFSLIGAGFMIFEIALIQRTSLFLGHPIYALGVILLTIIASTGIGSFISDSISVSRRRIVAIPLIMAAVILVMKSALLTISANMITASTAVKIATVIGTLAPSGILLGLFFPIGLRLTQPVVSSETPWFWALNGIFGVLCSALAVFISINFGISTNFHIAAGCYAILPLFLWVMQKQLLAGSGHTAPTPA